MQLHGEGYLLFNVLIDAVCILAAGRFLQLPMRFGRIMLASWTGGVYALLALWHSAFAGLPALLIMSLCMGMIAFPRHVLRGTGGIWLVGICGNGVVQTLCGMGAGGWITMLCAGCFMLTFCVMGKKNSQPLRGVMRIEWAGKSVHIPVMVDTGNLLREPGSGLPAVVVPIAMCRELNLDAKVLPQIFAQTASARVAFPFFRPDACRVHLWGCKEASCQTVVALTEEKLPAALLPQGALQNTRIKEERHADTGYWQ